MGTPIVSSAPGDEVSSFSMIAETATGIGTVKAHFRDLAFEPPEHTEKMPF